MRLARGRALASTGATILVFWAVVALGAPWIAPYDPLALDFSGALNHAPSASHWLGTDSLGRDLLSRIIFGARTLFSVVPLAVGTAFVVGIAAGAIAGYSGGMADQVISRLSDVMLAFPALIIYVILLTSLGPSLINIVIAVTLAYAPGVSRLARGQVLAIKELDYVKAAQASGQNKAAHAVLAQTLQSLPAVELLQALEMLEAPDDPERLPRLLQQLRLQPSLSAAQRLLDLPPEAWTPEAWAALRAAVARSVAPLQRYRCAACGFEAQHYFWQCPGCLSWDSYPPQRIDAL